MKVGVIGLGRMGSALVKRLLKDKHEVFIFDLNKDFVVKLENIGANAVKSLTEMTEQVNIFWLMVPVGNVIDLLITELLLNIKSESIIIDGGNSKYTDSIERAKNLKKHEIIFLDCGTSGGLLGEEIGFSLMVGGDFEAYEKIQPLLKSIAAQNGFAYMGPSGAGHFVKMIHNGIEYGILQAYAEGFDILKNSVYKNLDLKTISGVWCNGSVIRSWILDLTHEVFQKNSNLEKVSGKIAEGGTGKWTLEVAKSYNISADVLEASLNVRKKSRETGGNFGTKIVAMLRNKFGGHKVDMLD